MFLIFSDYITILAKSNTVATSLFKVYDTTDLTFTDVNNVELYDAIKKIGVDRFDADETSGGYFIRQRHGLGSYKLDNVLGWSWGGSTFSRYTLTYRNKIMCLSINKGVFTLKWGYPKRKLDIIKIAHFKDISFASSVSTFRCVYVSDKIDDVFLLEYSCNNQPFTLAISKDGEPLGVFYTMKQQLVSDIHNTEFASIIARLQLLEGEGWWSNYIM